MYYLKPFARGAMRECYRLKKLGSRGKNDDWDHAQNYVAKKYIRSVDKEVCCFGFSACRCSSRTVGLYEK